MCESALQVTDATGVKLVTDVREFQENRESHDAAKPTERPENAGDGDSNETVLPKNG